MRTNLPPVTTAIMFTLVGLGLFGCFVLIPIALIESLWNNVVTQTALPTINVWQASLLYIAGALVLYLTGFVRIEIEMHR
jgi:hypothetical protein